MDQAAGVRKRNRLAQRIEEAQTLGERGHILQYRVEPLAPHEFHHVIRASVGQQPRVVDRHDAGMFERRQDLRARLRVEFLVGRAERPQLPEYDPAKRPPRPRELIRDVRDRRVQLARQRGVGPTLGRVPIVQLVAREQLEGEWTALCRAASFELFDRRRKQRADPLALKPRVRIPVDGAHVRREIRVGGNIVERLDDRSAAALQSRSRLHSSIYIPSSPLGP